MTMEKHKRRAIEAAGFELIDAEDFLGLTAEERQLVELRVAMARRIRERRMALNMTQGQLAARVRSSQSRVAKMEAAAADVSLDLMFRSYFAVGGKVPPLPTAAADTPRPRTAFARAGEGKARPPASGDKAKAGTAAGAPAARRKSGSRRPPAAG